MPSVSKSQQRFFGAVKKCQDTGVCLSSKIKKAAKSMSKKAVKDFAKTKHKKLPERFKEGFLSFGEFVLLKEGKNMCECKCSGCKTDCKLCDCKNCSCKGCKCK